MEELHTQNHVIAVQGNGIAVHSKVLVADTDGHVTCLAATGYTITIGHHHVHAVAVMEVEADTFGGGAANEVGGGAGIQERGKLMAADGGTDLVLSLWMPVMACIDMRGGSSFGTGTSSSGSAGSVSSKSVTSR